jgi:hypothetical protein
MEDDSSAPSKYAFTFSLVARVLLLRYSKSKLSFLYASFNAYKVFFKNYMNININT